MDKRTTVAKVRPAKTVVMKTPPRMTVVMDRVSAQAKETELISAELGITRMPTGLGEDEGAPDQTSLFVRRLPTKEVKMEGRANPSVTTIQPRNATSILATRMVYADEHSTPIQPATFRAEIPLSRNPRAPLPPPGRTKGRAGTESVRRMQRLLRPAILVAVVAVSAVVILAQRSENVADAAGAAGNSSSRENAEKPDKSPAPTPHSETGRTPRTNLPGGGVKATANSVDAPGVGSALTTSESKAASLLISGHRAEALLHYRKLAALPNATVGVRAMFIVLEQKVKSP